MGYQPDPVLARQELHARISNDFGAPAEDARGQGRSRRDRRRLRARRPPRHRPLPARAELSLCLTNLEAAKRRRRGDRLPPGRLMAEARRFGSAGLHLADRAPDLVPMIRTTRTCGCPVCTMRRRRRVGAQPGTLEAVASPVMGSRCSCGSGGRVRQHHSS